MLIPSANFNIADRKLSSLQSLSLLDLTWLFVIQIIMAKPAGGPKPPSGKKDWDDDQND